MWMKSWRIYSQNGRQEVIGFIEIYPKENLGLPACAEGAFALGFFMKKTWRGKGYMTEAVHALTEKLFEEGVPELTIANFPRNVSSMRVAVKCGYQPEGIEKNCLEMRDGTIESLEYFTKRNADAGFPQ